jgi:hypothetical protein
MIRASTIRALRVSACGCGPATLLLAAGLAFAEPAVQVRYFDGVPEISITGDYARTRYTIARAAIPDGPFTPITDVSTLCLGSCSAMDYDASPGRIYWYRFDLAFEDGSSRTFGPYAVTISPTLARSSGASVVPNPMSGSARVELFLAGSPAAGSLDADAILFDLAGRRVRTIWSGALARGLTRVSWDGRNEVGRAIEPGVYYLRFASPLGVRVSRVLRLR